MGTRAQLAAGSWQTNAECGVQNAEYEKRGIGETRRAQQLKYSRDSRDEGQLAAVSSSGQVVEGSIGEDLKK